MTGFTNGNQAAQAVRDGKLLTYPFTKTFSTAGNSFWGSFYASTGSPAALATPATTPGTSYTNAAGTINFTDMSPAQKYLHKFNATMANVDSSTIALYDRLVAVSSGSISATGNVTINSTALPRYTDGVGVQAWIEVVTSSGFTSLTMSASSYTNEAGTTGRAGPSFSFTTQQGAAFVMTPIPLQAGDRGIRSVETINISAKSFTSITFSVVLLRPITYMPVCQTDFNEKTHLYINSSCPRIYDGASLLLMDCKANVSNADIRGYVQLVTD